MYMEYIQSLGGDYETNDSSRPISQVSNAVSNYGVNKLNSAEHKNPSQSSVSSSTTYNDQEDEEESEQPQSRKRNAD